MKDYTMDLARIAASIVTDCLGSGLTSNTYYSTDGNSIIMEFNGYPLRNSNRTGKVFVQFPRSTFYVRKGNMHFTPIQQAQCRYYQESMGNQFAHPHVYNDGHPSWDNSKRERPVDFITNIIETLSLQNVTNETITFGGCSSGIMGVKIEAFKNAQEQKKRVIDILSSKPIITDHINLKTYVNRIWCDKITALISGNLRKVVLENVTGTSVSCIIDMTGSPKEIVQELCESDPKAALHFFANERALDYFMEEHFSELYEDRSIFDLIDLEGDSVRVNWNYAFCDQADIKKEMMRIEREDQVPTFVVYVGRYYYV